MEKNKYEELRERRESEERKSKLPVFALVVIAVVAFGGVVTMYFSGNTQHNEQLQCDQYCSREYGLKGVLVPIITNQKTRPNASQRPYKCTCPRN